MAFASNPLIGLPSQTITGPNFGSSAVLNAGGSGFQLATSGSATCMLCTGTFSGQLQVGSPNVTTDIDIESKEVDIGTGNYTKSVFIGPAFNTSATNVSINTAGTGIIQVGGGGATLKLGAGPTPVTASAVSLGTAALPFASLALAGSGDTAQWLLKTATLTITSAQILAMANTDATTISIVSAPAGTSQLIPVLGYAFANPTGGTAYTNAGTASMNIVWVGWPGGSSTQAASTNFVTALTTGGNHLGVSFTPAVSGDPTNTKGRGLGVNINSATSLTLGTIALTVHLFYAELASV